MRMNNSLIHIDNLSKSFGSQIVLDNISLEINEGESIVIIGQSGCGKSVLLKHLIRLLTPDTGSVLFEGEDIESFKEEALVNYRRKFGMLFQSAALFDSMTVAENVGLGLKESRRFKEAEIEKIVREKLELVGLGKSSEKSVTELSGGMRKRVGLARAIAHQPKILLYDEPTTGLDPITADVIDNLVVELNQRLNVTSIAVTHDMKSAFKIARRVIMLYQGKIEIDGTVDEIRQSDNPVVRQFIAGEAQGPIEVG